MRRGRRALSWGRAASKRLAWVSHFAQNGALQHSHTHQRVLGRALVAARPRGCVAWRTRRRPHGALKCLLVYAMRYEIHFWAQSVRRTTEPAADTGLSATEVLTLALAVLSVLVALGGTYLANERAKAGEKTAREALEDARLARKEAVELALWTGAIEAANRLMGFDPAREEVGTRNQDLRIRLTLLIDHFHKWDGFDGWLAEELPLGAAVARDVMERRRPGETVTEQLERAWDYSAWAVALTKNLRYLRRHGYKPKHVKYLHDLAHEHRVSLYAANNWGEMPTEVPGIEELDDDLLDD